jgi:RHS repeat-associated protein
VHRERIGSTSITTDSNGVKGPEIRYYPWGGQRWSSGTTPTTFRYTGQRLESSIGLYFYNARWYDPAAGRFIQADTIVPGGVQGLDRYAYVNNNPLRYTDPSGHDKKSNECGPDGIYCDNLISFEEKYGISFSGEWSNDDRAAVKSAVKAVAAKFGAVTGRNSAFIWGQVYGDIDFAMGCSIDICGDVGGITNSAHSISFSALDSGYLRARNNVVHELGHAFEAGFAKNQPAEILGDTQTRNAKFPNRPDFPANPDSNWVGENWGFASGQNQFTWQMSYEKAGATYEEFADQFLGWTFNTWKTDINGSMTDNAQMRSGWMDIYMAGWLK